jgi:hypothetical protein
VAELRWRDKAAGRETLFPWPVPDGPITTHDPLVKQTAAGKAVLFSDELADDTLALALTFPGGVRFARISPDTDWALEERWEGEMPDAIRADLEDVWQTTITLVAAENKARREAPANPSSTTRGDAK